MWRMIDLTNAVTMLTLASGFAVAVCSISGAYSWALIALILAGICDLLDGMLARKLRRGESQQQIGVRLDSLVDVCVFGFAPATMLYAYGLRLPYEVLGLGFLVFATVLRVAYYDVVGLADKEGSRSQYYSGMPCTYVALVLPLVFLAGWFVSEIVRELLLATVVVLSLAMTTRIPVLKPRGLAYVAFALLALSACALLLLYPNLVIDLERG
jgi:CDP-diacylglycerol--serine O-phosphatidyltransferase